jgi:hypothetical protein
MEQPTVVIGLRGQGSHMLEQDEHKEIYVAGAAEA